MFTMKCLRSVFLGLLATLVPVQGQETQDQCPRRHIRPDWHSLTTDEKVQFMQCVRRLYSAGDLWEFCREHRDSSNDIHANGLFLPWHRLLVEQFTRKMHEYGCWTEGIPCWNASYEYNRWQESEIWDYFGSINSESGCIEGGWFEGIRYYNSTACVRRSASRQRLYSSAQVAVTINTASDYAGFVASLERRQHAQVHAQIGGHMGILEGSACDPIFYLHHCSTDCDWLKFQDRSEEFANMYSEDGETRREVLPAFQAFNWTIDHALGGRETLCFECGPPVESPPRRGESGTLAKRSLEVPPTPDGPIGHPETDCEHVLPAEDQHTVPPATPKTIVKRTPGGVKQVDPEKATKAKAVVERVKKASGIREPISHDDSDPKAVMVIEEALAKEIPPPSISQVAVPRSELTAEPLEMPPPLPDDFIERNGLDKEQIRLEEECAESELDTINRVKAESGGVTDMEEIIMREAVERLDLDEALKGVPVRKEDVEGALVDEWERAESASC